MNYPRRDETVLLKGQLNLSSMSSKFKGSTQDMFSLALLRINRIPELLKPHNFQDASSLVQSQAL